MAVRERVKHNAIDSEPRVDLQLDPLSAMSTEDIHAMQLSDKNGMTGRPEADEDARTESSEGSNVKVHWTTEVVESEDEFQDAMESPSSTSGMLLTFEGTAPPLSGVYEDVVEATDDQILAALESTGSDGSGRHSTIQEDDEEEEIVNEKDEAEVATETVVMAVVEGIVESAVTAEENAADLVDPREEKVVEEVQVEEIVAVTLNEAVVEEVAQEIEAEIIDGEDAATSEPVVEEATINEEPAVDEQNSMEQAEDAAVGIVAESDAAEEVEQAVAKVNAAAEIGAEPRVGVAATVEQGNLVVAGQVVESGPVKQEATEADDEAEQEAEGVNEEITKESVAAATEAALEETVTTESVGATEIVSKAAARPEHDVEPAVAKDESTVDVQAGGGEEVAEETQETEADGSLVVEMDPDKETFFAETAPAVDESVIDAVAGQTAMDGSNDVAQEAVLESAHEVAPATEEAEQETTEKTLARVDTAKVGSHEVPVEEAAVVGVVEDIAGMKDDDTKEATAEKVIEDDDPIAAVTAGTEGEQVNAAEPNPSPEEDVAEETGEQPLTKEAASATQLEVSENPEISIAEEVIESEVNEIVAQVTDELVEAVQLEQHQTEEVVVNVTEGTNKVQVDEEKPAPESAIEEVAAGESKPEVADVPEQENEAADNTVPPPEKKDLVDNNEAIAVDAQADTVGQNPAEEETDSDAALASASVPASAIKEVSRDSCRKSSDNNQHSNGVVLGLLPRRGPSSGTTTTTSIEPFVLSSESNEMLEAHVPPQRWVYEVHGFSIENRVVYYHIQKSDRRTGIREPPILKRYTDFRELHIQLLDTRLHVALDMPRIPRPHLGTVFRGYKSKKTIEIRETAFRAFLRYISQYPALHGSAVFEHFITTTRATTGAGWM